jgi:hypothetical protein
VIYRLSENNFNIVLLKVILSCEPHYFPVYVSFPGGLPSDKQTQVCGRFGVFSTNSVAGVCLIKDISWLLWSLQKCWRKLFGRQWEKNGHTVLSTPSSRYSLSGVRLPVVLSCQIACFRGLCSFKIPHNCCWNWSPKGKLLLRFSVMYLCGCS